MKYLLLTSIFFLASCNAGEFARKVGTTIVPDRLDVTRGAGQFTSNLGTGDYTDETWAVTIGWDLFTLDDDHRHNENTRIYREILDAQRKANEIALEAKEVYIGEKPEVGPKEAEELPIQQLVVGVTALLTILGSVFGWKYKQQHSSE